MFGACCTANAISLLGFKLNLIESTLPALKQQCQVSSVAENHVPNPITNPALKCTTNAATARGTCGAYGLMA
jgi:hypothetical protein